MALPKRLVTQLDLYCYAYASDLFADMLNPKYRGSNFSWEGFPEMVSHLATAGLGVHLCVPERHYPQATKYVDTFVQKLTSRWIKDAGLISTNSNPTKTGGNNGS